MPQHEGNFHVRFAASILKEKLEPGWESNAWRHRPSLSSYTTLAPAGGKSHIYNKTSRFTQNLLYLVRIVILVYAIASDSLPSHSHGS